MRRLSVFRPTRISFNYRDYIRDKYLSKSSFFVISSAFLAGIAFTGLVIYAGIENKVISVAKDVIFEDILNARKELLKVKTMADSVQLVIDEEMLLWHKEFEYLRKKTDLHETKLLDLTNTILNFPLRPINESGVDELAALKKRLDSLQFIIDNIPRPVTQNYRDDPLGSVNTSAKIRMVQTGVGEGKLAVPNTPSGAKRRGGSYPGDGVDLVVPTRDTANTFTPH